MRRLQGTSIHLAVAEDGSDVSFGFVPDRVDIDEYSDILRRVSDGKYDLETMDLRCQICPDKLLSWAGVVGRVSEACGLHNALWQGYSVI